MSDPRSDRTFKRIFHEHPRSLIHLLNTFLPLESPIESVEFMPMELHPEVDAGRLSIVDVRCRDGAGRNFIVEMQIRRTPTLFQRTMLNACRIFSRQADIGDSLEKVRPVYTLCLLDHVLFPDTQVWIHHFDTLSAHPVAPGSTGMGLLVFTFVEIRKWLKSGNFDKHDMRHAWMRFFTKPDAMLEVYTPEEKEKFREMYAAVLAWDLTRYTEAQLNGMDKAIDNYLTHQDYLQGAYREGMDEGLAKGLAAGFEQGIEKGIEKGIQEGIQIGRNLALHTIMALMADIRTDDAAEDEALAVRHGVTPEEVRQVRAMTAKH